MSNPTQILRSIERSVGREGVTPVDREILSRPHRPGMFHASHCWCMVPFLIFNRSQVPEETQDEGDGRNDREQADRWVPFCTRRECHLSQSCRAKQDKLPVDLEDHEARFYEAYRKVAEEYDKDFLKKYEEDLNTTLIFVSLASSCIESPLTRASGWSVFCSRFRLHHPSRLSTST